MCSIEHAPANSLFAIYFSPSEEKDREVRLKREDLKNVKALGIIAQVKDQKSKQLITLAYDPYVLEKHQLFGLKLSGFQILLISSFGLLSLACLGTLVYCLRKKHIFLTTRLDHVISYQEQ